MWEKNDKSGDRTIHQEAMQPSEWRAAFWRENASGWEYGSEGEMGVEREQKGNTQGLISAAGWSWGHFDVGMAEEVMSQRGDRETTRTRDSVQVFMWQPHS